ncbi:MAG: hypothetical protein BAA04_08890 [Firmicutes bacterium ZCTH02-B6]|nr:MAG: hypothetical protein BAA04_08890 [Firmicutes bacterium ZCTH02-B6]
MKTGWRKVWSLAVTLVVVLCVAAAVQAQTGVETGPGAADQASGDAGSQIVMDILDEDALLLVQRLDGRDVVRVLGRSQVQHRQRTAWSNELEYDEGASRAVLRGDVELVDQGDDPLNLNADYVELDLDTDAAVARGSVRFVRQEARGRAEQLHYGDYAQLIPVIETELAARRTNAAAVQAVLGEFLPDDRLLVLIGNVDMQDGDRAFTAEFVVINTRNEALLSVGRSAARLPGPGDE